MNHSFSFFKKLYFLILISLVSLSYAAQGQVEITIKGKHNDKERIVDNNSALFSGDSFRLEIEIDSNQYVYSFLLSKGEVFELDSGFKLKNELIILPKEDIYYLDDNPGLETFFVVGSKKPLDSKVLSEAIKKQDWESEVFAGAVVNSSSIKHLDPVTRGFKLMLAQAAVSIATDYLFAAVGETVIEKIKEIEKIKDDEAIPAKVITKLVDASDSSTKKTRGIKDIRVFNKASPAVVKIITKIGSEGSGSLITKDGDILTNWHVVRGFNEVKVMFQPKKSGKLTKDDFLKADVIKINGVADLAMIKLRKKPSGRTPLSISKSEPEVGQDVHAIGHPDGGANWTYTTGKISQIIPNDSWTYTHTIHKVDRMIQTQTPINPGNSGGPLLNDDGEIVGVNSSTSPRYEHANLAVSAKDIRKFLKQKGDVKKVVKKKKIKKKKVPIVEKHKDLSKSLGQNVVLVQSIDVEENGSKDFKISIDNDRNGKTEITYIFYEDKEKSIVIIYDYDEDGKWDEIREDSDNNGVTDTFFYSADDKDEISVIGYDDDEDGQVDRYEDYK